MTDRPPVGELIATLQALGKYPSEAELADACGVKQPTLNKIKKAGSWTPTFRMFLRAFAKLHGYAPDPLAETGALIDVDQWKPEPTATEKLDLMLKRQVELGDQVALITRQLDRLILAFDTRREGSLLRGKHRTG